MIYKTCAAKICGREPDNAKIIIEWQKIVGLIIGGGGNSRETVSSLKELHPTPRATVWGAARLPRLERFEYRERQCGKQDQGKYLHGMGHGTGSGAD